MAYNPVFDGCAQIFFLHHRFLTDLSTLKECNMTISPSKLLSTGLLCLAFLFSNTAFAALKAVIDSPEQAVVSMAGGVAISGVRSHGAQLTYKWEIDVAGIITPYSGSSISHQFNTVGEYTIKLTVTDPAAQANNTASTVKIITILPVNSSVAPQASFEILNVDLTAATLPLVSETLYTFRSLPTGTGNNNNWDFGEIGNSAAATANNVMPRQAIVAFGDGTATGSLGTITREFRVAGKFTITLASQTGFTADPTTTTALTGTYQTEVTVIANANPRVVQKKPIQVIYDQNCAGCHGIVDRKPDPAFPNDRTKDVFQNTIVKGENSFLAGRGTVGSQPSQVTEQLIMGAYNIITKPASGPAAKLMAGVYLLKTDPANNEAAAMVTYLAGLTLRSNQTGKQLYRSQCSRCHGTGTGAYAIGVLDASKQSIKLGIATVAEMSTIPASEAELDLIVGFLKTDGTIAPGGNAPLAKPATDAGLYIMYCSYCHGLDGLGGPFVDDSIANVGVTGTIINSEISKGNYNMMGRLKRLLGKDLLMSDLDKIAASLASLQGMPGANENDD